MSFSSRSEVTCTPGDKNTHALVCPRCPSVMVGRGVATFVTDQVSIPSARNGGRIKQTGETDNSEAVTEFWLLEDKFHFDNVGFSNTVQDVIKYLCCADCEVGPIGVHRLNESPERYLVAADRVRYRA